jgi:formiminotetrahydrofolate cyclodeaminase
MGGKAALNKLAVEDPATFVRVAASVVPKQLDMERAKPMEELTDAELTAIIRDGEFACRLRKN